MRMVLVLLPSKVQRKPRRCRGCFVPFFRKKVPKNSPADASAYFVPANVRNGRLFAGLQANRPRFLPLLAGTSFHGSGIGPESFAASGNVQEAQPPHSRLWRNKDNRGLRPRGTLYFLAAKSTDRSLRLVLFAAFWSAKSGAKTDPPTKKAKRRSLTLAPGDYSRVCKQTVPSARAFSPSLANGSGIRSDFCTTQK